MPSTPLPPRPHPALRHAFPYPIQLHPVPLHPAPPCPTPRLAGRMHTEHGLRAALLKCLMLQELLRHGVLAEGLKYAQVFAMLQTTSHREACRGRGCEGGRGGGRR